MEHSFKIIQSCGRGIPHFEKSQQNGYISYSNGTLQQCRGNQWRVFWRGHSVTQCLADFSILQLPTASQCKCVELSGCQNCSLCCQEANSRAPAKQRKEAVMLIYICEWSTELLVKLFKCPIIIKLLGIHCKNSHNTVTNLVLMWMSEFHCSYSVIHHKIIYQ